MPLFLTPEALAAWAPDFVELPDPDESRDVSPHPRHKCVDVLTPHVCDICDQPVGGENR